MSKDGTIYYIHCRETKCVKIGFTRGNPLARMASLQTGTPSELGLLAIHPGTLEMERELHEKFAQYRVRGEWFENSQEVFDHLVDVVLFTIELYDNVGEKPPAWTIAVLHVLQQNGYLDEPEVLQ